MVEEKLSIEKGKMHHLFQMVREKKLQHQEMNLYFFLILKSDVRNGKRYTTISIKDVCSEFSISHLSATRYLKKLRERKLVVPTYRVAVDERQEKQFTTIAKAMSWVRENRGTLLKIQYKIN